MRTRDAMSTAASLDTSISHRLGLPWHLRLFLPLNGPHPLVRSFIEGAGRWRTHDIEPGPDVDRAALERIVPRLAAQAATIEPSKQARFVDALQLQDQVSIEAQAGQFDTLFMHTAPLYCGSRPWIFHFESVPSVFYPFIMTGRTAGLRLRDSGLERTRQAFESPECRFIFTHIKSSREMLSRVFRSPRIDAKLHHVPLGIESLAEPAALAKFQSGGKLRILFTNSLHQDPQSFFLRGGHNLLAAFQRIRRELFDVELTIVSSMPAALRSQLGFADLIGVKWIQERVDDATLERLLLDHHLFALPAAGLHSYSLLRALSHGCVPIVSDALGYEEYTTGIEDSVLSITGIRAAIYREEPEGWISDDYTSMVPTSENAVQQIHAAVLAHADRRRLHAMAGRNLEHCAARFSLGASQAAFHDLVAATTAGSRG
jgi:glycosyltransferase involved in cell wall biosynthesis